MKLRSLWLLVPALLGAQPAPTAPAVSNRPAKADEWGYRPADGATVSLNPPSLTWVVDDAAATYDVQWSRGADFANAVTVTNIPWPTYTHSAPLAAGGYHWRYRLVTKTGAVSGWSVARGFTVPAAAVEFPMPTRAQQWERVPARHPRLFFRPEDLPRLRAAAAGAQAADFARLRNEADRIRQAGPTPEPAHLGSARDKDNEELVKYWWPNREQTLKACQEAETLAFVYLITQDRKYGEAARQWVLHLASWDPDGPTNFRLNCEAGKPLLHRPARAYDWAWDQFTPEDRAKIQAITQRRITDAWESGEIARGVGHLNRPYNSHGNRAWHKIAEAGIAFLDEIPEAPTWLDYAVNKFYVGYPVWADDDGGWHEGVSYWNGYLSKAVWWLQFAQSALAIDGLKKPFFAQVGDYPLYVCPPHSPNAGFGDLSFRPPTGAGPMMEYFMRTKGAQPDGARAAHWRWWAEQWGMKGEGGILGFLYQANLPPLPAARPPADLPSSKVFHGIGVASLHTTLLDAREDVHLLLKSSPMGSQSHGHNPQNTFQLNAYGEALLPACVYRDLHGSRFHYNWVHATVAQNGVLVDGKGQAKHRAAPDGRMVAERLGADFDYVAGDATPAYEGRLTRAWRQAVLVKGATPFVVLLDSLEAREPATFQFMLHAFKPFTLDEPAAALAVELPRAGLRAQYLSPVPLKFRQWDGYEPPPKREFPNQWHLEAGTASRQARIEVFTVVVPHRAGARVDWTAERLDRADGPGVGVTLPDRRVELAFRRSAQPAPPQFTTRDR